MVRSPALKVDASLPKLGIGRRSFAAAWIDCAGPLHGGCDVRAFVAGGVAPDGLGLGVPRAAVAGVYVNVGVPGVGYAQRPSFAAGWEMRPSAQYVIR